MLTGYPLVGVVHNSARRPPISNPSLRRTNWKLCFEALIERPANDLAGEPIHEQRAKCIFASEADVSYIGDSELIWS